MKESQIINKFRSLIRDKKAAQNFDDDVAKFSIKSDEEIIISKDVFVEDVHFLQKDGGFRIASKLLLSNISDIASAGAKPIYYSLAFAKNNKINQEFLDDFTKGLKETQDKYNLSLIGGDVTNSKNLFFSITIFGIAQKNKSLSCLKAKNDDIIFVSQDIGDAYLGLKIKQKKSFFKRPYCEDEKYLLNRHFFPTPRVKLGQKLIEKKLSSCATDVSDGLLVDLNKICKSSKLGANIFLEKVPFSSAAQNFLKKDRKSNKLDLICGGDDYELIFCAPKKNEKEIYKLAKLLKIKITAIGNFKKNNLHQLNLLDKNSKKINIKKFGYEH